MDFQKTSTKETESLSFNGSESGTGLNLSPPKDAYGNAAFSLASLDQVNRSGGSLLSLSNFKDFDTAVFLKSGSFDTLHSLLAGGSQIFKTEMEKQLIPPLSSNYLNGSNSSLNITAPPASSSPVSVLKSLVPTSIQSNVISTSIPPNDMVSQPQITSIIQSPSHMLTPSFGNNALIQPREDKRVNEKKDDAGKFVDVTPFLTLPQHEAAKKLGIPSSTLAKRWKEASCNRKWPYRTVSKLDKEILTLLKNVESAKAELSPSVEATLGLLLKKRNEELKTVLVRL